MTKAATNRLPLPGPSAVSPSKLQERETSSQLSLPDAMLKAVMEEYGLSEEEAKALAPGFL